MTETPLDRAWAAHEASPADEGGRLRFHERVLDAELFVPLASEAEGERVRPQIFDLSEGRTVLAFDREDRLAEFLGAPAEFAALSGRRLAALLAGQGTGIALNLGAPSATLLSAETVAWLAAMSGLGPDAAAARPVAFERPTDASTALTSALGQKLVAMTGVVTAAFLVTARYRDREPGLLLALAGVPDGARPGVAAAIGEAVRFSGLESAALDITFVGETGTRRTELERAGLRLDVPVAPTRPPGPGMEPSRPPRLRRGS